MPVGAAPAKYTRWAWPHPMIVLWILNPVAPFNELLLGQRLPKLTLIDQTIDRPYMERSFVPCPACGVMHDGRLWSWANAFGHWFGYVCPSCGGEIPCLWSLASLLVLAVTAPLWALPVLLWKARWLEFEKRRVVAKQQNRPVDATGVPWMKMGVLGWGGVMWLLVGVLPQVVARARGREVNWSSILIQLPVWLAGGYFWGRWMRYFMSRRPTPGVKVIYWLGDRLDAKARASSGRLILGPESLQILGGRPLSIPLSGIRDVALARPQGAGRWIRLDSPAGRVWVSVPRVNVGGFLVIINVLGTGSLFEDIRKATTAS